MMAKGARNDCGFTSGSQILMHMGPGSLLTPLDQTPRW